jgi:hypothetical protein
MLTEQLQPKVKHDADRADFIAVTAPKVQFKILKLFLCHKIEICSITNFMYC